MHNDIIVSLVFRMPRVDNNRFQVRAQFLVYLKNLIGSARVLTTRHQHMMISSVQV